MRRLVVSIALVAVLVLTGCGGSDDSEETAATTTAPPPSSLPIAGNDQAGTPFCQLARTFTEKYNALLAAASDPVKLRTATSDAESAIRQAQATAPAAIKPDVTVVATTASQVLAGLQKNNFVLANTPEVTKLQDPNFQKSFAALQAYARAHCGLN